MPTRDSFLDALSFLDAPAKPAGWTAKPVALPPDPVAADARRVLQRELELARAENERLRAARAKPPAPVAPIEPRPVSGRPDFAAAIDAMVAGMVASGDVYLDGDTYRTRKRAWKYAD